jgi:hypothetical protein
MSPNIDYQRRLIFLWFIYSGMFCLANPLVFNTPWTGSKIIKEAEIFEASCHPWMVC